MSIVFALAFVGLGAGVYWAVQHLKSGEAKASSAPVAPLESPAIQANAAKHPLQKYIEVSGVRFYQNAKKDTEVRFVVINHSDADISDLAGTVSIFGRTNKAGEEAVGTFGFKVPSLAPNESKELTGPLNSKLKVYELPDWQNVTTEVQITAP